MKNKLVFFNPRNSDENQDHEWYSRSREMPLFLINWF